ncbi:GDYXXLXY domain-containing protein [Oxalobacteraceae bacterium]|nr:GDYXXLXY domain-containing protein [Oxalobacteraceae bacterium]
MTLDLNQLLQDAKAAAVHKDADNRPWPVLALSAIGAWIAAIPIMCFVAFTFYLNTNSSTPGYVIGPLLLLASVILFRGTSKSIFVEQLALPLMLVGMGCLAFSLANGVKLRATFMILALLAGMLAVLIPKNWLRILLGMFSAAMVLATHFSANRYDGGLTLFAWIHLTLALWLLALQFQRSVLSNSGTAALGATLEAFAGGWIVLTLIALALWAGVPFLLSASSDGFLGGTLYERSSQGGLALQFQLVSVLLAGLGAALLARRWPSLRHGWCACVLLVLLAMAWCMPSLGAVLLVLAICLAGGRWRSAAFAAVAAVWIVTAAYYQLAWPLTQKAALFFACGLLLIGLALLAMRGGADAGAAPPAMPDAAATTGKAWLPSFSMQAFSAQTAQLPAAPYSAGLLRTCLALCALAVLAVANVGIWQKEDLIAHGDKIYLALAPVDPRSLMQGDYMQLNFSLPLSPMNVPAAQPQLVARSDATGVATLLRYHEGSAPLAAGEFLLNISYKNGRTMVVTDAWFFKEGEGERFAKAKYGEFRVTPDGKALLVGLRGPNLEAL